MSRFIVLVLAIFASAPAFAGYAAIAYNKDTGRWGADAGGYSLNVVESRALDICGASCFTVAWGRNAYVILAAEPGRPQVYGWAWNTNYNAAVNAALSHCNANASISCVVVAHASSFN